MSEHDTLEWRELARGIMGLARKAAPLARTLTSLVSQDRGDCISIGSMLERMAARYPETIAIKHEGEPITYAAFNAWVNRIAHWLIGAGVGRGDAVVVLMENRPAVLAVVAAITKVGGIAGMINTNQRQRVLLHSLRCCNSKFYMIGEELIDAFEEVRDELDPSGPVCFVRDRSARAAPHGYVDLTTAVAGEPSGDPPTTDQVQAGDACFYIFTSGTTGLPKASIMTHLRWLKAGSVFGDLCLRLEPGNTVYAPLPLYHNQALTVAWASALTRGAALAIRRRFSVRAFWDECRRHDAVAFVYIGELTRYLMSHQPAAGDRSHPVRRILGNGMRPDIWLPFKQRFGITEVFEIYAASEMNITFVNVLNLDRTVGLCPLPWALVRFDVDAGQPVRGPDGRLVRARKGEAGLFISKVTPRFGFDGYTDSEASERKLLRNVFADGDVWFNSGDLMRSVGFGHLQFVDRVGDTFRWKSENVSTTEVEQAIARFAGVGECTVYGVEIPGAVGRAGMAAVVPAEPASPIDLDALLAHLRGELPGYAIPLFVRITDSLEVTGTFKHRKIELRAQGYDPGATSDPIFVLLPGAATYRRHTAELHEAIRRREHAF